MEKLGDLIPRGVKNVKSVNIQVVFFVNQTVTGEMIRERTRKQFRFTAQAKLIRLLTSHAVLNSNDRQCTSRCKR